MQVISHGSASLLPRLSAGLHREVVCSPTQGVRLQKACLQHRVKQQIRAAASEDVKSPDDSFVLEMIQSMLNDSDLRKQLDQALSPEAKAKLSRLSAADAANKASEQSLNTSAELKEQLRGTGCSNLQELFSLMGFSPAEAADLILSAHEQSGAPK
ncbi:hypothetical protein WJX74_004491 [Apatococcus lobatus]|uniref:Uncharacterized protein n=1 Tax=Apatococcus lobatus TaxID=904363 RepID=A0AAW1QUE9_9CHLO